MLILICVLYFNIFHLNHKKYRVTEKNDKSKKSSIYHFSAIRCQIIEPL